jgi:hypothetical protein
MRYRYSRKPSGFGNFVHPNKSLRGTSLSRQDPESIADNIGYEGSQAIPISGLFQLMPRSS